MRRLALIAVALLSLAVLVGVSRVVDAQSGFSGAAGIPGSITQGISGISVTSATPVVIWAEPSESASTLFDYAVTVVCSAPSAVDGGDAGAGSAWRGDLTFSYERIGSAAPTIVGSAPTASNVRTTGAGAIVAGASVAVSGNSVEVLWGGAAGDLFDCSARVTRTEAP